MSLTDMNYLKQKQMTQHSQQWDTIQIKYELAKLSSNPIGHKSIISYGHTKDNITSKNSGVKINLKRN